jgi:1,2-dihydroxy-3-keto-5-methylthiopentene dioxygenase
MAIVRIPDEDRTLTDAGEVTAYLAGIGIDYENWEPAQPLPAEATNDEILAAYDADVEKLKARGGYVTADVINVNPQTPGLEAMLAKFSREHIHTDDEVRFIVQGRGVFHIHPRDGAVVAIEVGAGDLIRVPKNTWHWFDLCADRQIRAIRLFQDPAGWTPHYTESSIDAKYQPLCLGPSYLPVQPAV